MKRIQIIVLLALILILQPSIGSPKTTRSAWYRKIRQPSPTQVESIENIGQWEFLSVSDEELIDTIRRGFLAMTNWYVSITERCAWVSI